MTLSILRRVLLVLAAALIAAAVAPAAQPGEGMPLPVELVPQLGHGADIRNLAFSPDGRLAASLDDAGTLKLWELEHGLELRSAFVASGDSAMVLGFSSDGRTVYVAGREGLATVDVASGASRLVRTLRPDLMLPDGRTYVQSARRKGVVIGDIETRKEEPIAGISDDAVVNEAAGVGRIAVLHLYVTREILVVDVDERTIRRRIAIPSAEVKTLVVSPDGAYVALIERIDRGPARLAVYRLDTGQQTMVFDAPGTTRLYAAVFLSGSRLAVGGSLDLGGIRVFDAGSGGELSPLPWPREAVDFLALDPAGGRIAIVSKSVIEMRAASGLGASEQRLGETASGVLLFRSGAGTYYAVRDREGGKLTVHSARDHATVFQTPVTGASAAAFLGERAVLFHRDAGLWLKPLPAGSERKLLDVSRASLSNVTGASRSNVLAFSESFERSLHVVRLGDDNTVVDRKSFEVGGVDELGVVLSPDGTLLAARIRDRSLVLLDTASGTAVSQLTHKSESVFHTLKFSTDGRALVFRDDARVRVWRGPPWTLAYDRKSSRGISDVDFSPDGTRIWAVGRDGVFEIALASPYAETSLASVRGRALITLPGTPPGGVVIGENGERMAFQIRTTAGATMQLRGNASTVTRAEIDRQGAYVATSERDRRLGLPLARVWDLSRGIVACHLDDSYVLGTHPGGWIAATGGEVRLLSLADCAVEARLHVGSPALGALIDAAYTEKGEVVGVTFDGRVLVLDPKRGLNVANHRIQSGDSRPALVYRLGAVAYFDAAQNAVRVVEPRSLGELARFDTGGELPMAINGVPGTSLLIVSTFNGQSGRIRVWDAAAKRLIRETAIGSLQVSFATVDIERGLLLVGFQRGVMGWWRLDADKPEHGAAAHFGAVNTIRILPGGAIVTAGEDGAVRLWRGRTAAADVSLIGFASGDWVAATSEGYFNASRGGADGIAFRRELSVLPLNQFYDVFYRPDIVEAKLRGEDIKGLVRVTVADALANPPPEAEIVSSSDAGAERTTVSYSVRSTGGGVGDIRIYHNGKLLLSDEAESGPVATGITSLTAVTPDTVTRSLRGLVVAADAPRAVRVIAKPDLVEGRIEVENVPGENEIAIAAFNRTNTVQSSLKSTTYSTALAGTAPKLYIVAIGIDDYAERPLKFAVKDARDIVRELKQAAASLYPSDRVEVVELYDAKAGRAGIVATLDDMARRLRPWDALVLFVASHGLMHEGQYTMVTHDFRRKPADQWFVSTGELMQFSKKIRSLRQVFVFDTCHAGGLNSMVTGLYDARMTVMARNMGLHLLTAASKSEEAIDGYQGNGLFTHALLQALRDPATDINKDLSVSVMELGATARDRATEIARRIRYSQTPLAIHFGKDQVLYQVRQ